MGTFVFAASNLETGIFFLSSIALNANNLRDFSMRECLRGNFCWPAGVADGSWKRELVSRMVLKQHISLQREGQWAYLLSGTNKSRAFSFTKEKPSWTVKNTSVSNRNRFSKTTAYFLRKYAIKFCTILYFTYNSGTNEKCTFIEAQMTILPCIEISFQH